MSDNNGSETRSEECRTPIPEELMDIFFYTPLPDMARIPYSKYLQIPSSVQVPTINVDDIGPDNVLVLSHQRDFLKVMAANCLSGITADPDLQMAIGFLRAKAVEIGWLPDRDHSMATTYDAPEPSEKQILACQGWLQSHETTVFETIAYYFPFAMEHTLRTIGRIYDDINREQFRHQYKLIFRSSSPAVSDPLLYVPGDILKLTFGWIPVQCVVALLETENRETKARIPESVLARKSASPAGAAIITTAAAVFAEMKAKQPNIYKVIQESHIQDIEVLKRMRAKIQKTPYRYHKTPSIFGQLAATATSIAVPRLSSDEKHEFENAKEAGERCAPICQAYIDVFGSSPFRHVKVFQKSIQHYNTVPYRNYSNAFRRIANHIA